MAVMDSKAITAQDIADYFLADVDSEAGDNISNLKLQKLLYYAQGLHLAIYDGRPLFADDIKAWQFGPVVPDIYREYQRYGAGAIPAPETFDPMKYDEAIRDLLNEVATVYGQFSASRLMNMTHAEPPWKLTGLNEVISHEIMRDYFETQLVDEQNHAGLLRDSTGR